MHLLLPEQLIQLADLTPLATYVNNQVLVHTMLFMGTHNTQCLLRSSVISLIQ